MLPFYYRMVGYAPPVGTTAPIEIFPVRPVEWQTIEAPSPPSSDKIKPADSAIKDTPLAAKKIPSFMGPGSFHLDAIWKNHAPTWVEVPHRILVATDETAVSEPALQAGKALAAKFHGTLEARNFKGNFAEISQSILDYSQKTAASLLVLGTHHREGKSRVQEGSIAEVILKEASCPVLLVSGQTDWGKIKRMLLPVGETTESFREIATGIHLASHFGAETYILHLSPPGKSTPDNFQRISHFMKSLNWNLLEEQQGDGTKEISETITSFAKSHSIDLILMGTHSERIHHQLLPSSTCLEVLRQTPCPLWVIH
jgi:nucleotide-binding universal stress UspA family protein